jgi:hypothetical protein
MRVAFVDDSEQTNPPRAGLGHLLAFAAAIFPQEDLTSFAEDLSSIVANLGIPPDEEMKWNPPKGSFLKGADGQLVKTLRRRMLDAALDHQVRTVTVIIDHGAAYKSSSKAQVGKTILKWLFERVSMHLGDHDDVGIMIADKPGGGAREEKRWLANTLELTNDGTEYVEPGRVVLPVVTADSRHVPHLQLADLIVAATTGAIAGNPPALARAAASQADAPSQPGRRERRGPCPVPEGLQPALPLLRRDKRFIAEHEHRVHPAMARLGLCHRRWARQCDPRRRRPRWLISNTQ